MQVVIQLRNYIAKPYWPETDQLININKGINPRLGDRKKKEALEANIKKAGFTKEQYDAMVAKSKEQWYRNSEGTIFVPRHQLTGMLVQAVRTMPKAICGPFEEDSFRAEVIISNFITDRKQPDHVYDRYVRNEDGKQRRFQSEEAIGLNIYPLDGTEPTGTPVEITGSISFVDTNVKPELFFRLLSHALLKVGVGSARKMGYGRGKVIDPSGY